MRGLLRGGVAEEGGSGSGNPACVGANNRAQGILADRLLLGLSILVGGALASAATPGVGQANERVEVIRTRVEPVPGAGEITCRILADYGSAFVELGPIVARELKQMVQEGGEDRLEKRKQTPTSGDCQPVHAVAGFTYFALVSLVTAWLCHITGWNAFVHRRILKSRKLW